jgi:hypothetical protein
MVDTITLSLPAVDVLTEQLHLNVRQYPFELPRIAGEERQRARVRILEELERNGLADARGPQPEVEDALHLLCGAELTVAVAGVLDLRTGWPLTARVVVTGEVALVGVLDGRGLRMDFLTPDSVPSVCADLLPDAPPGSGSQISVGADGASRPDSEGARDLRALLARPKFRIGHYVPTSADRGGRRARLPGLTWFDNDRGRYLLRGGPDGLTCLPAGKARIAEHVDALLHRVH